jgi:N-acetylmuramoyl-L-alanine amidase
MHQHTTIRPPVRITATRAAVALFAGAMLLLGGWMGYLLRGDAATPAAAAARAALDPVRTAPSEFRWTDHPEPHFAVPPYARFLKGMTIVLDPGHVGQSERGKPPGWKRGPTGLREAEVNLRVAQFLREFLESVGARVILTREVDRSLELDDATDLAQRAEVANRADADLLLSIHHNAGPPDANYTSVWYHRSASHSPASLAAARCVLDGLNEALRLESHLECALLTDELQFRDGFALLRLAKVPAVLSEASFHSNPAEEQRLRDPVYNRREAYGLFMGLARWAQAGLPRVEVLEPTSGALAPGATLVLQLHDGLSERGGWGKDKPRILADSIVTRVNGERVEAVADLGTGRLRLPLAQPPRDGRYEVFVDFENIFGQHVLQPLLTIPATNPAAAASSAQAPPPNKPAAKKPVKRPSKRSR